MRILPLVTALLLVTSLKQLAAQDVSDLPKEVATLAAASFPEYAGSSFDQLLRNQTSTTSPIIIARTFDSSPGASVNHPGQLPRTYIDHLVDQSNIVITGVPIKRWTIPTVDKSFAVSIYLVHLVTVACADSKGASLPPDIYVARGGGPFDYEVRHFRAIDPDFHLFHLNEQYIFFANRLGENLYKVFPEHALQVHGDSVREASVSQRHADYFSKKSVASVLGMAIESRDLTREKLVQK